MWFSSYLNDNYGYTSPAMLKKNLFFKAFPLLHQILLQDPELPQLLISIDVLNQFAGTL